MIAERNEWVEGWPIVATAVIGIAFGLGPLSVAYTLNLFVEPLIKEFGWSRQQVLTIPLIVSVCIIPSSFALSWVADKWGGKIAIIPSQIALAISFISLGVFTSSVTSFYLLYGLMSILAAGSLPIIFNKLVAASFDRHRGLALGIALSGYGLCALTVPSLLNWVIENWGWRIGYLGLATLPLCIALPATLLLLPAGLSPGTSDVREIPVAACGITFAEALINWRFWVIGLCFFLWSASVTGIVTNFSSLFVASGYTRAEAASLQGIFGSALVLGRLGVGALVDRFWGPAVGISLLLPASIGTIALAYSELSNGAYVGIIIVLAFATGAELDLCAFLTSRYFGLKNFSQIYSVHFILVALGGGAAAPYFGMLYDQSHSYAPMLLFSAAGFVGSGILLLSLGRYPVLGPSGESSSSP